jgi:hypothetical protein
MTHAPSGKIRREVGDGRTDGRTDPLMNPSLEASLPLPLLVPPPTAALDITAGLAAAAVAAMPEIA